MNQEQLSISYPGSWLLASCTSTYTFCKVPIIPRKSAFLRAFICCRMKLSFSLSVSQNRLIAMSVCVGIVKQSFGSSGGKLVVMACSWCGRNDLVMVQTVRVAQNGYCKTTAKFAGSRILIAVLARPPSICWAPQTNDFAGTWKRLIICKKKSFDGELPLHTFKQFYSVYSSATEASSCNKVSLTSCKSDNDKSFLQSIRRFMIWCTFTSYRSIILWLAFFIGILQSKYI